MLLVGVVACKKVWYIDFLIILLIPAPLVLAIIAPFTCAPREVKNRHFGFLFLFLFLFFSSGPTAIVSDLLTLVYMYIRSIF